MTTFHAYPLGPPSKRPRARHEWRMSDSFYVAVGVFFLFFGFAPVRNYVHHAPLRSSYHQLRNHREMMANLVEHNPPSDWMYPLRDFSFANAKLYPPPGFVETDLFDLPLYDNFTAWRSSNSPEMMPWDNSLNKDLQEIVYRHVLSTRHIPEDHPSKFSLSTPKRIEHAYRRLLDPDLLPNGAPPAHRIKQDIERVFYCMDRIYEAGGRMVKGLAERNGLRWEATGQGHGGARYRLNDTELRALAKQWVLPEVAEVMKNETKRLLELLRSNNNDLAEEMEEDVGDYDEADEADE